MLPAAAASPLSSTHASLHRFFHTHREAIEGSLAASDAGGAVRLESLYRELGKAIAVDALMIDAKHIFDSVAPSAQLGLSRNDIAGHATTRVVARQS